MIGKWVIIKETIEQHAKLYSGCIGRIGTYTEHHTYPYTIIFSKGKLLSFKEEEFIVIESRVLDAMYSEED